jgi:hypothetical protein
MARSQVVTFAPDGTKARYLGALGPVSGLKYSYSLPGGCDQLSCLLQRRPDYRTEALNPGRIVRVIRGAGVVWEGKLDEPTPSAGGWQITSHGSGTWGADHVAEYTGSWGSGVIDRAVNDAISRGLGWSNPGVGSPTGLWLGQAQDSASLQIDELLNLACTNGGLTWQVRRDASGNVLQVFPLPSTTTHLLICTDPAPRTLGGDVNTIFLRYCSAPDFGSTPAAYATTKVVNQQSINQHGEMEAFTDLSSAGPMLATDAQAVGNYVLQRYTRANFAGPFTVYPGQLLTLGGQPVDLGVFFGAAPMVCRLILLDEGWGGELTAGPVQFIVGGYEWDEDAQQATVTPFLSARSDFAAFLSQRASQAKGRKYVINPHGYATYTYTYVGGKGGHGRRRKHKHWHTTWHWA